jgi:hypothetical protein
MNNYITSITSANMQYSDLSGTHNHISNPQITSQSLHNVHAWVNGRTQIFCPELHTRKAK